MKLEDFIGTPEEKPLDRYAEDGGFAGIFRTIGCIGDSLASGEFEVLHPTAGTKMYLDRFDYSWGQYIARIAGSTVYNFSRGGMTAKEYNETFGNAMGYFRPELAADAYIIALGVNDLMNRRRSKQPLEYPSAGSVFKRCEGRFTGEMIEKCGLKGYRIGGAQVSEKHAGFIVNRGGATAQDVLALIDHIKKTVYARYGVSLECEVRVVGE